jgi:hypothetical protein
VLHVRLLYLPLLCDLPSAKTHAQRKSMLQRASPLGFPIDSCRRPLALQHSTTARLPQPSASMH